MSKGISTREAGLIAIDKSILPMIGSVGSMVLESHPYFSILYTTIVGLYGGYLSYNQSKINEFSEFIQNNQNTFTKDIVSTEAFKDGFIVVFEAYIKTRTLEKRKVIQNIFLGFTILTDEEKEAFELERILDVINKLSINAIRYINFLVETIEPYWLTELSTEAIKNSEGGLSESEWIKLLKVSSPMTSFVSKWIWKKFDYSNETGDEVDRLAGLQKKSLEEHAIAMSELTTTGIFNSYHIVSGGGIGSDAISSYEYNFNGFGKLLISNLRDVSF